MSSNENIKRLKTRLSSLKRSKQFVDYRHSFNFAQDLVAFLNEIEVSLTDPEAGLDLVAAFLECDDAILGRCDDSGGCVGQVFQYDAPKLFAKFAVAYPDKTALSRRLIFLYSYDPYGVRGDLLDIAGQFIPDENLRDMAQILWAHSGKEQAESHEAGHWLIGVKSIARQLKDGALFEKAYRAGWPGLSDKAYLEIGEVYFEGGDIQTALSWVEAVADEKLGYGSERDELLLKIYEKLNDRENLVQTAWRIFHRHRCNDSLEDLIAIIGMDKREQVIGGEVKMILRTKRFSYSDAKFLIDIGRIDEAEAYLFERAEQFDGEHYSALLPLADGMEKNQKWLTATVIYRALLCSILERAISKYYHHGVRYLKKLDKLFEKISDWKDIEPHAAFKGQLLKAHARKAAFLGKYHGNKL